MEYKLIAFDLDGTLLNDKKEISPETLAAISEAAARGKHIILNTGRNPRELPALLAILPEVRYVNCISGALVYDAREDREIADCSFDAETVDRLFAIAETDDCMAHLHGKISAIQADCLEKMAYYNMGQYHDLFVGCTERPENLREAYRRKPFPVGKFNFYCASTAVRARLKKRVEESGIACEIAFSEEASLEVSPFGIHKGIGMKALCDYLGLDIRETIAVGDAGNDLMALKTAGLGIAVANAKPDVLAAADAIVADNNHDGCAEAIRKYLLRRSDAGAPD